MSNVENYALIVDNIPYYRVIKEIIRIINANKIAKIVCMNKFNKNKSTVDL